MSTTKNFMGWDAPGVAVITGASSGIGAEFARQLAAQGFSTILVARRKEKLANLASSLTKNYSGTHEVLVADLSSNPGIEAVERRIAATKDLDVLVNNAGFGTIGKFQSVGAQSQLDMLQVHVVATVRLTQAALPAMVARKRGAIINTASLSAYLWIPGSVMYNATKAFIRVFSESLAMDLQGTRVRIQALCPGFTHTEFHDVGDFKDKGFNKAIIPGENWTSVEQVVTASLAAFQRKTVTVVPGKRNEELVKGLLENQLREWERSMRKI